MKRNLTSGELALLALFLHPSELKRIHAPKICIKIAERRLRREVKELYDEETQPTEIYHKASVPKDNRSFCDTSMSQLKGTFICDDERTYVPEFGYDTEEDIVSVFEEGDFDADTVWEHPIQYYEWAMKKGYVDPDYMAIAKYSISKGRAWYMNEKYGKKRGETFNKLDEEKRIAREFAKWLKSSS